MEAGFGVIFRLPKDASTDDFHPDKYSLSHGACLYLNYGYQMKSYFSLTSTTLFRLYVASKQHCHSPASQRQPHPCVRKRINANLSSCAPVKSKLKFSTNQSPTTTLCRHESKVPLATLNSIAWCQCSQPTSPQGGGHKQLPIS